MSKTFLEMVEQYLMEKLINEKLAINPNMTYEELDAILDRSWHSWN